MFPCMPGTSAQHLHGWGQQRLAAANLACK
jgi:hypothetical protein